MFRRQLDWNAINVNELGDNNFLGAPQLPAGQMNPLIYNFVTGPPCLAGALEIIKYKIDMQVKPQDYPNWHDYSTAVPLLTLNRRLFYKVTLLVNKK